MEWIDPKKKLPNCGDYIFILKRVKLKQKYHIIAGEFNYCPDSNHNQFYDKIIWNNGVFRSHCGCLCICIAECFMVNGEHFVEDIIGWALKEDVIKYITNDFIDSSSECFDTCEE